MIWRLLKERLRSYKGIEKMDKNGDSYYVVEEKILFKWKPVYTKTYGVCDSNVLKYSLSDNIVRFRELDKLKDFIEMLVESRTGDNKLDIVPLAYVRKSDRVYYCDSLAWCVPIDYFDNLDGYFDFALKSYKTMEEAKEAIDKWVEEKSGEANRNSKFKKYGRVIYRR